MNRVMLRGVVVSIPTVRYFGYEHLRLDFKLQTCDSGASNQEQSLTHHIVAWSEMARRLEDCLQEGYEVYLEGRITYDTYIDRGQEALRPRLLVECLELQILSNLSGQDTLNKQGHCATVEIDWADFAPDGDEDPMA